MPDPKLKPARPVRDGISFSNGARVKPKCHYFGSCGGCAYQDLEYAEQLELKRRQVEEKLEPFRKIPPSPLPSPPSGGRGEGEGAFEVKSAIPSPKPFHYRRMIALNVIRRERQMYLGYIGKDGRSFVPVDSCAIADERINSFFPEALRRLEALPPRKRLRTSQIVLRAGDDGQIVTSLRDDRGKRLECTVGGKVFSYSVASFFQHNFSILEELVGAVRGMLTLFPLPHVLSLGEAGRGECGKVPPTFPPQSIGGFVHNALGRIRPRIVAKVLPPEKAGGGDAFLGIGRILLDLYSGVGLFAISLADAYSQAIGIEEGFEAVQLAKQNAEHNGIRNVEFYEGKVEEMLPKFFPRGKNSIDVVLDPPRAGLKPEVIDLLAGAIHELPLERIQRLVYVSCHLDSLARDLERLTERFQIVSVQPIDLFPQTKHIETIVLLKPKAI